MATEKLLQLDPSKVLAEDNTRFGLKPSRIESLTASILETGGVLQPVEVAPLPKPVNGFTHRLTAGFYRHAAVTKLNKEQAAGLTLPAIEREVADDTERLRHQLAENMERENQSPMDQAVAIKRLMDAEVPRAEIRRIFARPGGKKGNQMQPASNAWLNIILSLLTLPKSVQNKIHDGRINLSAAYELGKAPADKREAIIERAEAELDRQAEIEAKDEEKFLNAEKKAQQAETEKAETLKAIEDARKAAADAAALVQTKAEELKALKQTPVLDLEADARKTVLESVKAAENNLKGAQKAKKDADNELAALLSKQTKTEEAAKEARERLAKAREDKAKAEGKAGKGKGAAVSQSDVKKAAKAEGVNTGAVALNASEVKQVIKDVMKSKDPHIAAVGKAFADTFAGVLTTKQLLSELEKLTK